MSNLDDQFVDLFAKAFGLRRDVLIHVQSSVCHSTTIELHCVSGVRPVIVYQGQSLQEALSKALE